MLKIVAAVVIPLACAGCLSTTVSMYPVEGARAKQAPLPVVKAQVNDIQNNTGSITMTDPDGETCTGTWSSGAPAPMNPGNSLVATYGGAAGVVSQVPAASMMNRGEAFITCERGTTYQVEFYTGNGTANGFGVAKDSRGNVYKLLF